MEINGDIVALFLKGRGGQPLSLKASAIQIALMQSTSKGFFLKNISDKKN